MINDSEKLEFYEEIKEQFKDEIIDEFFANFNNWYVESEWYNISATEVLRYYIKMIY